MHAENNAHTWKQVEEDSEVQVLTYRVQGVKFVMQWPGVRMMRRLSTLAVLGPCWRISTLTPTYSLDAFSADARQEVHDCQSSLTSFMLSCVSFRANLLDQHPGTAHICKYATDPGHAFLRQAKQIYLMEHSEGEGAAPHLQPERAQRTSSCRPAFCESAQPEEVSACLSASLLDACSQGERPLRRCQQEQARRAEWCNFE